MGFASVRPVRTPFCICMDPLGRHGVIGSDPAIQTFAGAY